jgi:cytochrome c-type biogenesis protein CcmH/NrfG
MKQFVRLATPLLLLAVTAIPAVAQQSGEDFYWAAQKLYDDKKFDEALAPCLKAIELSPNDPRPHEMAGFIYAIQRKYKSSSDALAEALRLQPQRKDLYVLKARIDRQRNAPEEAIVAARKAIELDPNYAEAYALLGEFLAFDIETRAAGIDALRTAVRLDPKLFNTYAVLGKALMFAKDERGAEVSFNQGIVTDPKHMAGRFWLGRLLVKQGRLAEARKLWNERTSDIDDTLPQFIDVLERAEKAKRDTETPPEP